MEIILNNITGYGSKGEGVARLDDGRVVFVRGAARGDICKAVVTSRSKRSCRAEIIEIIEPSPYRIKPDCPAYPQCGGCDFRHISYDEELRAKLHRVNDALRRIGKTEVYADEIISTGQADGYRNKAVFHIARHGDETSIGFYRAGTNEICPVRRCLLLPDELNAALDRLWSNPPAESSATFRVGNRAGSMERGGGSIVSSAGNVERSSGPIVSSTGNVERSSGSIVSSAENVERVGGPIASSTGNMERVGGSIVSSSERIFSGNDNAPVIFELDGLSFQVSHTSFFQVNNGAALLLFQKAREYASVSKSETLVDLYCGVGSLTLLIGRDAGFALGVESKPAAVSDAFENARRNGLGGTQFIRADAAVWDQGSVRPDCVVVDPPRKGLAGSAARKILELSPSRIVYISCDPATLARDIGMLSGYEAKRVCAVDMFPRTANVECCILLRPKQDNP